MTLKSPVVHDLKKYRDTIVSHLPERLKITEIEFLEIEKINWTETLKKIENFQEFSSAFIIKLKKLKHLKTYDENFVFYQLTNA